jgi:hypothetical protein
VATPSPTPQWGLHLLEANIALGNLIAIVKEGVRGLHGQGLSSAAGLDTPRSVRYIVVP